MSSRKRSCSGHAHPQNTRSTRRRSGATSASADTEANDGGEPRSMAVSTVTMPAAGTPEAVTATQSQSASSSASAPTSALSHAAPSTSGPFVQYVPGANRARHGPPHVCTVCNKSFTRPSTLATHMNIHSGATPYVCGFEGCNARFNARSNATRHRYLHGATFAQKQADIETGRAFRGQTVTAQPAEASSSGVLGMPVHTSGVPASTSGARPVATGIGTSSYEIEKEYAVAEGTGVSGSNEAGPPTQQAADREVRWMPVNQVSRKRISYSPIASSGIKASRRQAKNAGSESAEG